MQKAGPYGSCLNAILTERRLENGPQGHSLTLATVHRKETAIIHTQPVNGSLQAVLKDCMLSVFSVLFCETSAMFTEIQSELLSC